MALMTTTSIRSRQRAERHRARAISYRADAVLLLEQYGEPDSAGALLYEAAKQCVNALANQAGENPGTTGAKVAFLRSLASQPPGSLLNLGYGWGAANQLHIHADRGNLDEAKFRAAWTNTQTFIANMLAIYAAGQ